MDPAELLVSHAAAVSAFRDKHPAGYQTGMAPAALAAAAVRGNADAGTLHGAQQALVCPAGNGGLFAANPNGDGKLLAAGFCRIALILRRIAELAAQLEAHAALGQAQLGDLAAQKVIHGLGAADKHAVIASGVLLNDVGGDKAVLITLHGFVGQHMDDLDPAVAAGGHRIQLILEQDAVVGAAAVEDGQIEVLDAVGNGTGHGEERRNAAAACQSDHVPGIAQVLIVEVAQRAGHKDLRAHLEVGEDVLAALCALAVLDGQRIAGVLIAQSILGTGAQGIGLVGGDAVHIQRQGHILTGAEIGQRLGALALIGDKDEALGIAVVDHLCDLGELHMGVQLGCKDVGIVNGFRQGRIGRFDMLGAGLYFAQEGERGQTLELGLIIIVFCHITCPPSYPAAYSVPAPNRRGMPGCSRPSVCRGRPRSAGP